MIRDISASVASLSLTVASNFGNSEGRRGMYSGRASMRSRIFWTAANTGAWSGSSGRLKASRGASSSAYATKRRSASPELSDAPVPAGRIPVSERFVPVVEARGSTGAAFCRVARIQMATATPATTTPPIRIASDASMERG